MKNKRTVNIRCVFALADRLIFGLFVRYALLKCELHLMDGCHFDAPEEHPWKGSFDWRVASWEALGFESAMEIFWRVHDYIQKNGG